MQCLGRTRYLKRCRNQADILLCRQHRLQPWALLLSISSLIGLYAGIYQDIVRPVINSGTHAETREAAHKHIPETINKGGLRYSIAVASFHDRVSSREDIGMQLTNALTEQLERSQEFVIVAPIELRERALDEQDFVLSGRAAKGTDPIVAGQMTPAELIIRGEITSVRYRTIDQNESRNSEPGPRDKTEIAALSSLVLIVEPTTGQLAGSKIIEVDLAKDREGSGHLTAVSRIAERAVQWITQQVGRRPWSGQVLLVTGTEVYINRGSREGVTSVVSQK